MNFDYLYPNLNDPSFNINISKRKEFYDNRYKTPENKNANMSIVTFGKYITAKTHRKSAERKEDKEMYLLTESSVPDDNTPLIP